MGRGEVAGDVDVELVADVHADIGEGPVWWPEQGLLLWVDITRGHVHVLDPATSGRRRVEVGQPVGAVVPRRSGGLALAVQEGFALADAISGPARLAVPVGGDPSLRMNDGKCDPQGRFWAGTMAYDEREGAGTLYRLDPDLRVGTMLDGLTVSNGMGWSLDGRTMYFIDTPTQRVDAFDFDPGQGAIANRRPLVEVPPEAGLPDGMTVDAEGFLWVALWGGWAVRRYAPDGTLDRVVRLPVSQVSSCTFGGPDLDELYVTSAASDLAPAALRHEPHAGGLFRHRPGVRGLPVVPFAG
jgi:sugar lactone lactonase YvrE